MFAFYALSGALIGFSAGSWLNWRRFLFLLVPFLLWNLIAFVLWRFPLQPGVVVQMFGGVPFRHGAIGALWFLKFLCLFSLVSPALCRTPVWVRLVASLALVVFGSANVPWTGQDESLANEVTVSFGFFMAGTCLRGRLRELGNGLLKAAPWILPTGIALATAKLFHLVAIPLPIMSVVGVLYLFSFCILVERWLPTVAALVASRAKAVFFVFAFHQLPIVALAKARVDWGQMSFLWPFLIFFFSLALYRLIVRFAPALLPYLCLEKRKRAIEPPPQSPSTLLADR